MERGTTRGALGPVEEGLGSRVATPTRLLQPLFHRARRLGQPQGDGDGAEQAPRHRWCFCLTQAQNRADVCWERGTECLSTGATAPNESGTPSESEAVAEARGHSGPTTVLAMIGRVAGR